MSPSRASAFGHAIAGVALVAAALLSLQWQAGPPEWRWPGGDRLGWAALALLLYATACALLGWRRRVVGGPRIAVDGRALLIAYASQTGFAEQLARRTADSLSAAGCTTRVVALGDVQASDLAAARQALFVVSTTGEGDAPDRAFTFLHRVMGGTAALHDLQFGLLALGDRSYQQFCGFGLRLEAWLRRQGATPWFDRVEVDDGDPGALRRWQHCLGQIAGSGERPGWTAPAYESWTLAAREHLNPGSPGGAVYRILLVPPPGLAPYWQAGDIAEISPRPAPDAPSLPVTPLPHRDYSIASLPADGGLELLVRQLWSPEGRLGLGSGWLTRHAVIGGAVEVRLRENRAFHPPPSARPLVLIGNGTGLAGLRAHLKARAAGPGCDNWLLFGERTRRFDFLCRAELETWLKEGRLSRLDLAFSRDGDGPRYVQDALRAAATPLREWIGRGAAVYVCGSLRGMAPAVDVALREILGTDAVDELLAEGRYRRDVY